MKDRSMEKQLKDLESHTINETATINILNTQPGQLAMTRT